MPNGMTRGPSTGMHAECITGICVTRGIVIIAQRRD
jgi:hypothetical protein